MRAIKRQSRDNDAAFASKREKKDEEEEGEEEGEKTSETFERSATPRKFDNRLHNRVQPTTSTLCTMIIPIESLENVFETMNNLLATNDSKLVANVGRSRSVVNRLGPVGSKIRQGCPEGNVR